MTPEILESFDAILISSLDAEFVKNIMDSSPMAVRIATPDAKKIIYANPVYLSLMEFDASTLVSEIDPSSFYANEEDFHTINIRLKNNSPVKDKVIELKLANGKSKWVIASYFPSTFNEDPVEIAWFYDITESVIHRKNIEDIAHRDHLTGLYNRISFTSKFESAMQQANLTGKPIVLGYLDLDGFKEVNDSYGHDVGDQLLKKVSSRIQGVLRANDILARLGGDEFALLITDFNDYIDVDHYFDRMIRVIGRPFSINNKEIHISASIGITIYPDNNSDFDTLLRHADQAMYQAKNLGKNRVIVFDIEESNKLKEHRRIQEEVSDAVKNGEMQLYYQPQVSLKSKKVVGFEALIRWAHPSKGIIAPVFFLPAIEGSPVEMELGEWVLRTGFNQMLDWNNKGFNFKVSVNVTSEFLTHPTFMAALTSVIAGHSSSVLSNFQLEIVESSAFSDIKSIAKIVSQCAEKGIKVSLDDFGTGFSSLSHLRYLSVSQVKIDKSFVMNMVDDQNDYYTVKGVLGLAGTFHHTCVAEGVESLSHGSLLVALGCDLAQGYFISRPIPASAVISWYNSYIHPKEWEDLIPSFGNKDKAEVILLQLKLNKWIDKLTRIVESGEFSFKDMEFVDYASLFFRDWLVSARKGELSVDLVQIEKSIDWMIHLGLKLIHCLNNGENEEAHKTLAELNNLKNELELI